MLTAFYAKIASDESQRVGNEIGTRAWLISEVPSLDPVANLIKKLYHQAHMESNHDPNWAGTNKNTDCGVFVKASVGPYDPSFPSSGTINISPHLTGSRFWKLLPKNEPLRPGDVMVITGPERGTEFGHTAVVGSDKGIHEASLGDYGPRPRSDGRFGRAYRPTPMGMW